MSDTSNDLFAPATPGYASLRQSMFPELADDALFDSFILMCRARGVNPWCKQVRPKVLVDDTGARRVELMLCIEGFRLIAHRTQHYAGCDDNTFAYGDDGKLASASTTIYKLVGDNRFAFTASVRWSDYAGIPATGDIAQFREQMPHVWLGKCSEAAALRKAFPQELGGMYTPEEMAAVDSRPTAKPADEADQRTVYDNEDSQLPAWEQQRYTVGVR
jgi:phage recombination protein Bet